MKYPLIFSPEVLNALQNKLPVVALESTIISHGMPFPHNRNVAMEVENAVRANGAVPATIAILKGEIHVGLTEAELNSFAETRGIVKCSRRDLPFVLAEKKDGATTVAATMIIAEMAGIPVFATGGIGGVHRNAENTFDVSADLIEFSKSNVAVISAGAKAILDLPKTLEYLETFGVPVIGFGTDTFPAFYSMDSGIGLHMRMDSAKQIASFISEKNKMGLSGGMIVANPIPVQFEIPKEEIEPFILKALEDANAAGIEGKELTPFLLKRLNEVTSGRSQSANRELILNNAALGAKVATELARLHS